jgi:hypothetical protein
LGYLIFVKTNLLELANNINKLNLFITGDTGPMYVTSALGKENLVKEDILHLSLRHSKLYRELKKEVKRMYELLNFS